MSIITRIKEFISSDGQRAVNDLPPALTTTWTRHSFSPITNWDSAYRAWKSNPVAQACTITYSLMMPEAQIGVVTPSGYDYEQPIIDLLTRGQWRIVFGEILTMLSVGGNAYGYKLRNASGAVIGLRWYNDKVFAPVDDGYGDVMGYHYTDGARTIFIDRSEVVHIRGFWYDPEKPLGGASPVALAYQSIEGFNEAASTVFNIHKNDAVPKTTILLNEEASPEQIDVMSKTFKRRYGGQNRGSVGVLWGVQDIKRLALDWDELGLSETFGQYETRICGTYKVHPIIAGTHMGLSQSTYSNFEQASKDFTNMVRVPFWNMIADQLNAQLAIPDYEVEIGFDLSTVQALAGQQIAVEAVSTVDSSPVPDVPQTAGKRNNTEVKTGGAAVGAAPFRKVDNDSPAVIVDVDGTLLTESSGEPIQSVIDYVNGLWENWQIHIVSGRNIERLNETINELDDAGVLYDDIHLDDFPAGSPRLAFKEYKAKLLLDEYGVHLAIDNDADARAMYRSLGIDTENPANIKTITIGPATKAWLQNPDGHAYAKAYDETIQPYADRIAYSWSKALMQLARELRGTKTLVKADDFNLDVWTAKFLEETNTDREELISLAVRLSQEEVDAEPGEFRKARDEGRRESSDMIKTSVETLKAEVQDVIRANPLASGDELGKLLYDKFETFRKPLLPTTKQTRADVIGRTTATATTGVVQKNVWGEIGGIKRSWVALAEARAAHAGAHDQLEDSSGNFTVGGEVTPYPSGPGLSAANSVNCRCFTRARRQ